MDTNRQKRGALEKKVSSSTHGCNASPRKFTVHAFPSKSQLNQHVKQQKPDVAAIQQEIQMFDRDLAQLEADHFTYKRNSVAMASTVQWDAMLELSAKMQIIATFGKYLTEQIPLDRIPPGILRPPFAGGAVTNQIVQDCHEALMAWRPPTFGGEEQAVPEHAPSPIEKIDSPVDGAAVAGEEAVAEG